MTDDQRLKILNDAGGFNAQNGIMVTAWDDGFGSVRVDLRAYHVNPMRLVHGGLYTSMLDVALAMTGSYQPAPLLWLAQKPNRTNLAVIRAVVCEWRLAAATAVLALNTAPMATNVSTTTMATWP